MVRLRGKGVVGVGLGYLLGVSVRRTECARGEVDGIADGGEG